MLTDFVHRTAGDCLYVRCRPAVDHRELIPSSVRSQVGDDVVVKAYRLRTLAHVSPLGTPRSGYYHQVCVAAVMVGDSSVGAYGVDGKHWNYVMWNESRESLEGNLETGHRKRVADIREDFIVAPEAEAHAFGQPEDLVRVHVTRSGKELLDVEALLGPPADPKEIPIYTGVAGERADLLLDGWTSTVTPYPVSELSYWSTRSASGSFRVGRSDGLYEREALEVLRGAVVLGCWFSGVSWSLAPVAPIALLAGENVGAG